LTKKGTGGNMRAHAKLQTKKLVVARSVGQPAKFPTGVMFII
jgi:hypothetical protein